jgi:hypothetical protein
MMNWPLKDSPDILPHEGYKIAVGHDKGGRSIQVALRNHGEDYVIAEPEPVCPFRHILGRTIPLWTL